MKVHRALGNRMGRDVFMLSISIDPERDTPEVLHGYAKGYGGPQPGWLYLTGDYDEITTLRRQLGVYDLDPVVDADKTSHSGLLTFGNDETDRWSALPALTEPDEIVRTMRRITRKTSRRKRRS